MEKAKKLFEKRVGANTSDGHDDITDDEEYMEEIIKSKKGICPILTRVNLCLVLLLGPNKQPILDPSKIIWTRLEKGFNCKASFFTWVKLKTYPKQFGPAQNKLDL